MIGPSRHSDVMGGSTAARVVNCPGSTAILAKLPKQINQTSEWALEGTDLHTVLATMIDTDDQGSANWPVVGSRVGDTEITQELLHDCIIPCWTYWTELRGEIEEFAVEIEAAFPHVYGAFSTLDLAARSDATNTTYLTDWKMGAGHSVAAVYPDPDDERYELVNEQLLFCGCCLRAEYPDWFPDGVRIVLTIVQPRNQDPELRISQTEVSNEDLDAFEADVKQALRLAAAPNAPQKIGPWCKFAACKPMCALHNAPLIDLAAIKEAALPERYEEHTEALARVLALAPLAEAIIAEARKQAHELLESGKDIPGWKLVAKRGVRRWNDSDAAIIKLLRKRFKLRKAQVLEPVLKSPAQVEKLLPKGVTVPPELAGIVSSGSTLAPDKDKRPPVLPDHENLRELLVLSLEHESQAG